MAQLLQVRATVITNRGKLYYKLHQLSQIGHNKCRIIGKIIGNVRKHRDVKFVTTETKRNYLVSEKYYTAKSYRKFFLEKLKSYRSEKNIDIHE